MLLAYSSALGHCPRGARLLAAAFWALSAAGALAAFLPGPLFSPLRAAVLQAAGRGKLWPRRPGSVSVPQRWFWHFYLLGAAWTAALLMGAAPLPPPPGGAARLLLALMLLHCVRRLYEAGWCAIYAPDSRMHLAGYLYGLLYYTAAPLSLWLHGCGGGGADGAAGSPAARGGAWGRPAATWCQVAGTAVFVWGSLHQWRCHAILVSLRAGGGRSGGPAAPPPGGRRDHYGVPRGDWFEHVTSAHYLAEIVIYAGLVVASGGRDAALWLLFAWVVANLTVAAEQSHAWYLEKFEDYPKSRRVLFPHIY